MAGKCVDCDKPLKNPNYTRCYDCNQIWRERQGGGDPRGGGGSRGKSNAPPSLPNDYLKSGYFDDEGVIRPELVTTTAEAVAKSFGQKLKNHQLRRFYQHAKAVEARLKMGESWRSLLPEIKKLHGFAAEAKGKDKIPSSFFEFIDRNINAINNEKSFTKGFLQHFESTVAYFTYYYPRA